MSDKLLIFAKTFLRAESNAETFVDEFISQWKQERDNETSLSDDPQTSEALSSIFCLADMFNPNDDRESYEFDETKLRSEMEKVLRQARLL
jgi:FMN-dependent NADH-azoreductase